MMKMMVIKVVLVDDDSANIESTFLTPEHIIYVYQSPGRRSLTTREHIIVSFYSYITSPSFKCTCLCITVRACLYFILKFFICRTWGIRGDINRYQKETVLFHSAALLRSISSSFSSPHVSLLPALQFSKQDVKFTSAFTSYDVRSPPL